MPQPSDNAAYRFPVSVMGVVIRDSGVILLKNERDEWELPGGKLEIDEVPERCLAREILEELDLEVQTSGIVDSWVYEVTPGVRVFIITYGCVELSKRTARLSNEHNECGWHALAEVGALMMPTEYKRSITMWAALRGREGAAV